MVRDPLFPFDVSPAIMLMMPLMPLVPEFSVFIVIIPELVTVPIHDAMVIFPPSLVDIVVPPVNCTFPPLVLHVPLVIPTVPVEVLQLPDSTDASPPTLTPCA